MSETLDLPDTLRSVRVVHHYPSAEISHNLSEDWHPACICNPIVIPHGVVDGREWLRAFHRPLSRIGWSEDEQLAHAARLRAGTAPQDRHVRSDFPA